MDNGTIQSGGGYSRYTFRKGTYLGAFFVCIFRDGRAYIGMCGWKPLYISEHLSIMGVLLLCENFISCVRVEK